mgnify:CR=1 FL=1
MQNTTTNVIAICLAAALLFVAPLISLTERNDSVVQENVELIVSEFVTDVQNTGVVSQAKYQSLENSLAATGNTYNIEMEIQHLDENPGKKTTQANYTKIGENVYYSDYTTQILNKLESGNQKILLNEGDRIIVNVKNTNETQAQTLKGSLLSFTNAGQYKISASSTGMINVNGK